LQKKRTNNKNRETAGRGERMPRQPGLLPQQETPTLDPQRTTAHNSEFQSSKLTQNGQVDEFNQLLLCHEDGSQSSS
jgi:hypothetical protein